jgi:riboflavin biosynthesis pyrimidine reductase
MTPFISPCPAVANSEHIRIKDMKETVQRLFPLPSGEVPLRGLYLEHDLRQFIADTGKPFFLSNFVTSLDGRIAISHSDGSGMTIPKGIANRRDWRLFQELAVQADLLISSGRYLREYAQGKAQEILNIYRNPEFTDLRDWRISRGLPPYPDLAILSRSMEFSIPDVIARGERKLIVLTSEKANPERVRELEAQGVEVIVAGEEGVEGHLLSECLSEMGYRLVYSTAGQKIFHLLLSANLLDRLYLTIVLRAIAGTPYATITEGPLLTPPVGFNMESLYYDRQASDRPGQLFLCLNRVTP